MNEFRKTSPETFGLAFKYKLRILFKPNKSTFGDLKLAKEETNWLSDRLKLHPSLRVKLSANLGHSKKTGEPTIHTLDEKGRLDGKVVTNREATIIRGEAVKSDLEKQGVNSSQIQVGEGKSLSGKENRNVELEFKK